jgi:hypothetical protein
MLPSYLNDRGSVTRRVEFLLAFLLATVLLARCGEQDTPVEQAEEEDRVEEVAQSPQEEFSTASPERKAEL